MIKLKYKNDNIGNVFSTISLGKNMITFQKKNKSTDVLTQDISISSSKTFHSTVCLYPAQQNNRFLNNS